jgi:predicted nucleic acid-binding protein
VRSVLLDTGALVALLDRSEKQHSDCVEWFRKFEGQLLTTEPVLTETIYLLGPKAQNQIKSIDFILQEGAVLIPQSRTSLLRAKKLIEKYSNIPMDFADATLVALAEETGVNEIFSLDRKGFQAYRINGRKSFIIYPN